MKKRNSFSLQFDLGKKRGEVGGEKRKRKAPKKKKKFEKGIMMKREWKKKKKNLFLPHTTLPYPPDWGKKNGEKEGQKGRGTFQKFNITPRLTQH